MSQYTISNQDLRTLKSLFRNLDSKIDEILSDDSKIVSNIVPSLAELTDKKVDIKLLGDNLLVEDILIPLVSRKITLRLIKIFVSELDSNFTRKELINRVYSKNYDDLSERMKRALDKNIMKLLSRTRSLLENSLAESQYSSIRWIVYDEELKGWNFYK